MRLFAKYFLCATFVMSIALLFSGYLLITYSHESAINREAERALNQYQYDKFTVQADLIANAITIQNEVSYDALSRLSSDLSGFAAFFAEDKSLLYSTLIPETDFNVLNVTSDNTVVHQIQTVNETSYLMVCGKITQGNVTLYMLVATDISSVFVKKKIQHFNSTKNIKFVKKHSSNENNSDPIHCRARLRGRVACCRRVVQRWVTLPDAAL